MLIQVKIKNERDHVHIFQYIYFENFQIRLRGIMDHFEQISHDTHLDF